MKYPSNPPKEFTVKNIAILVRSPQLMVALVSVVLVFCLTIAGAYYGYKAYVHIRDFDPAVQSALRQPLLFSCDSRGNVMVRGEPNCSKTGMFTVVHGDETKFYGGPADQQELMFYVKDGKTFLPPVSKGHGIPYSGDFVETFTKSR